MQILNQMLIIFSCHTRAEFLMQSTQVFLSWFFKKSRQWGSYSARAAPGVRVAVLIKESEITGVLNTPSSSWGILETPWNSMKFSHFQKTLHCSPPALPGTRTFQWCISWCPLFGDHGGTPMGCMSTAGIMERAFCKTKSPVCKATFTSTQRFVGEWKKRFLFPRWRPKSVKKIRMIHQLTIDWITWTSGNSRRWIKNQSNIARHGSRNGGNSTWKKGQNEWNRKGFEDMSWGFSAWQEYQIISWLPSLTSCCKRHHRCCQTYRIAIVYTCTCVLTWPYNHPNLDK